MAEVKTVSTYRAAYTRHGNRYYAFRIGSVILTADGDKVDVMYRSVSGAEASTLYCKGEDGIMNVLKAESDVFLNNATNSRHTLYVDEDGFYVNAVATDGTRSDYHHRLPNRIEYDVGNGNYNVGKVAFDTADAKMLEAYAITEEDGSTKEKVSVYDEVSVSDADVAEIKAALDKVVELLKAKGLRLFFDNTNETLDVGSEKLGIAYEGDTEDGEEYFDCVSTLKTVCNAVDGYNCDGDYIPSIVRKK